MKVVAQWRNYKWVNFYDEDGNTRCFTSVDEAKEFIKTRNFSRAVDVRICEYNGERSYTELVAPMSFKEYK